MVDLDVDQGSMCIPGCLTVVPLDKAALSVEVGSVHFCHCLSPLTFVVSQTGFKYTTPLIYFHGYTHPKENIELYRSLVTTLAARINDRLSRDLNARASGIVVNTNGWIDGEGFNLMLHTIQTLAIDVVLVVSHDKLYSTLGSALKATVWGSQVTVVKLPKSGGVVSKVRSGLL